MGPPSSGDPRFGIDGPRGSCRLELPELPPWPCGHRSQPSNHGSAASSQLVVATQALRVRGRVRADSRATNRERVAGSIGAAGGWIALTRSSLMKRCDTVPLSAGRRVRGRIQRAVRCPGLAFWGSRGRCVRTPERAFGAIRRPRPRPGGRGQSGSAGLWSIRQARLGLGSADRQTSDEVCRQLASHGDGPLGHRGAQ